MISYNTDELRKKLKIALVDFMIDNDIETIADFSRKYGYNKSDIIKMLDYKHNDFMLSTIVKLASILNVSIDYLVGLK